MLVISEIPDIRREVQRARQSGLRIGCVPTMGALHAGHVSLIEAARKNCEYVVLTIFVNPTQFGPAEDFSRYPRPLEKDLDLARGGGTDLVFTPPPETIYPPGFTTYVNVENLGHILEGAIRPTHFRGVATVVTQLLNIVRPDEAFFGAKDFQQQALIKRMVRDLHLPVEITTCPTIREPDGLAMSSRNIYLNTEQRAAARLLSQSLFRARDLILGGELDLYLVSQKMLEVLTSSPLIKPDYALIADPETLKTLSKAQQQMVALVAARLGTTRLIDNLPIQLDT